MAAKPGWYQHPQMQDTLGYWDGDRWTGQTQPMKRAGVPMHRRPAAIVGALLVAVLVAVVVLAYLDVLNDSECAEERWSQGQSAEDC